ncbi:hypothetical protein P9112_012375 [Eukaryota sp. TZLM1-RC]
MPSSKSPFLDDYAATESLDDVELQALEEQDEELSRLSDKVSRINRMTYSVRDEVNDHLSITARMMESFGTARTSVANSSARFIQMIRTGGCKKSIYFCLLLLFFFFIIKLIFSGSSEEQ